MPLLQRINLAAPKARFSAVLARMEAAEVVQFSMSVDAASSGDRQVLDW
jgi:hypothetical protein